MAEHLRFVDAPLNEERTNEFWLEVGCVGPAEAHSAERSISQMLEQQQRQTRVSLAGTAEMRIRFDGPVAFTPHGYHHSPRSGDQDSSHRL